MKIFTIKFNCDSEKRFNGVLLELVDKSKILIIPEIGDFEVPKVRIIEVLTTASVKKYLNKNPNLKCKIELYMEIDEEQL